MRAILGGCLVFAFLIWGGEADAGVLSDRLANFPNWESKPPVASAEGDLMYPDWMAGNWNVTSILVDLVAPLAPEIVTPGFESNRRYLQESVRFKVRFKVSNNQQSSVFLSRLIKGKLDARGEFEEGTAEAQRTQREEREERVLGLKADWYRKSGKSKNQIVGDRSFNGLNIGRAYLGEGGVLSVKVDPNNPNRQITFLRGERQLISIVTNRGSEIPNSKEFIASEISQQVFQGESQVYLNEVETTTAYQFLELDKKVVADQMTAIYLSPQDPDYFAAMGRPVALYRYRLELVPAEN